MWWLAEPHDLHRVSERVSTIYVERCHVDRAENAVVIVNKERTVRVPAAMIAAFLLGPGTRITHGAVRLLADSGSSICWVGEHGVRMYAAGLGPSRGAQLVIRQAHLVSHTPERLAVARRMYAMRFPDDEARARFTRQPHCALWGRSTGMPPMYSRHAAPKMAAMAKTQTACSIITSFR